MQTLLPGTCWSENLDSSEVFDCTRSRDESGERENTPMAELKENIGKDKVMKDYEHALVSAYT